MVSQDMYMLGSKRSCIRDLFEYGIKKAAEIGRENVYDYSLGNPSIPCPPAVNEAIRTLTQGDSVALHGYTPAGGTPGLRAAVAKDLTARSGMTINAGDVFVTCGAAPALTAVLRALAVENSEIVTVAPFFPEYTVFATMSGHRFVVVPADEECFQINMEALAASITPDTQALLLNSPNNPSGVIYSEATLKQVAELLTERSAAYGHPVYLIADEPYRELVYDGAVVPFIPAVYPDTIICYSWSKSLSLPGERIGYVCVPPCVTDHDALFCAVAGAARAAGHVCAPSLLQKAVEQCIGLRPDVAAYDRNRMLLYSALTEYGYTCVKPEGAFYLFVKAPGGDAQAFSDAAKEKNLLVVPGGDFGCPGFFRLSTCVAYDMIQRSLPAFRALIEAYR